MTTSRRVLITGATGFLGRGLVPALSAGGYIVRAATRAPQVVPEAAEGVIVGDLRVSTNLSAALADVEAVVHLAGMPPGPESTEGTPYRDNNFLSTQRLAESAARAGVKRFIYLSSVRAQSGPTSGRIIAEDLAAAPTDAYGRSKLEAEHAVTQSGVPAVILRPALVHGPGMRFNMATLLRIALTPYPLPIRSFPAKRSIIARTHLADAVLLALSSEAMAGETYLVADPEPLSVAEMVGVMRSATGRWPKLMPMPPAAIRAAARLVGRAGDAARLDHSLVLDPSKLLRAGWMPRLSTRDALAETVRAIVLGSH
jgi:nucleoside-diphosphate-sugar epimerase